MYASKIDIACHLLIIFFSINNHQTPVRPPRQVLGGAAAAGSGRLALGRAADSATIQPPNTAHGRDSQQNADLAAGHADPVIPMWIRPSAMASEQEE